MEIMANSDNVLRGGLTPKHVDIPELMKVVDFEPQKINTINPVKISKIEWLYPCDAEEFALSRLSLEENAGKTPIKTKGPEILICTNRGCPHSARQRKNGNIKRRIGFYLRVP